jgi:isoleucyl-tRNA synthetase
MGTLWNTYAFYVLYANIDNFNPLDYDLEYDKLSLMDKWLLSKLNSTVKAVDTYLGSYKIPETTRVLEGFVDDLSNWYVRRGRERYWAKGMEQDKINAYMTLYTALVTIAQTVAPMIPFMAEDIYQNLVRNIDKDAPVSVHLCSFPTVDESMINEELEIAMDEILKIVVLGRAARNSANIKNRQPIGTMYVKADKVLEGEEKAIVEDELNVKNVVFSDDVSAYTTYSFKPQLRTVGPKYGKHLGKIKEYLSALDGNAAMAELKANGVLSFEADGENIQLSEADLLIDIAQMEGFVSESDRGVTVVIDTNLSEELLKEGFVREIVSKVQTMRKEAGFEVMDRITVYAQGGEKAIGIISENADNIVGDVMATEIVTGSVDGYTKEWNINGEEVTLGVKKND